MEHPLQRLWNKPERLVIGFMSGTSADGVDAALVRISGYGVETRLTQLAFCFTPFDEATRAEVLRLAGGGSAAAADFCRINFHLGQLYCEAGDALCRQAGIERAQVDLIGCHGQTLWHIPQEEIYLGRSQHSTFQLAACAMWPRAAWARRWCPIPSFCFIAARRNAWRCKISAASVM